MAACAVRQPQEPNAASHPACVAAEETGGRGAGEEARSSLGHRGLQSPGSLGLGHESPRLRLRGADCPPGLPWDRAPRTVSLYCSSHAWRPPARCRQPRFAQEDARARRDYMTCEGRTAPGGRAQVPVLGCLIPSHTPVPASHLLPQGLWTPGRYSVHTQPRGPELPAAGTEMISPAEHPGPSGWPRPISPTGLRNNTGVAPSGGAR